MNVSFVFEIDSSPVNSGVRRFVPGQGADAESASLMVRMEIEESLAELVMLWVMERPVGGTLFDVAAADFDQTEIPPSLLGTITNKEPARSLVLADAKILLRIPTKCGIGINIEISKPFEIVPFDDWEQTISPLKAVIHWSLTMSGDNSEYRRTEINRVVFEDERWKIASILNDQERAETINQIEIIREAMKKRTSK